jgi:methylmalonyl-CoA mutase N-terminal domain/subunit
MRASRDGARVVETLAQLRKDAEADRNVMPAIVEAVKAYATVGEITNELVAVYGRYKEPVKFERDE